MRKDKHIYFTRVCERIIKTMLALPRAKSHLFDKALFANQKTAIVLHLNSQRIMRHELTYLHMRKTSCYQKGECGILFIIWIELNHENYQHQNPCKNDIKRASSLE